MRTFGTRLVTVCHDLCDAMEQALQAGRAPRRMQAWLPFEFYTAANV